MPTNRLQQCSSKTDPIRCEHSIIGLFCVARGCQHTVTLTQTAVLSRLLKHVLRKYNACLHMQLEYDHAHAYGSMQLQRNLQSAQIQQC